MQEKEYKEFIRKAKDDYRKIGSVLCPAFNGESVYFTRKGFNHLLRKGKDLRPIEEQVWRLNLLVHVPKILSTSTSYSSHHIEIPNNTSLKKSEIHFWSFKYEDGAKIITLIVCQLGTGIKHFLSIFDNKGPDSTQAPFGDL